MIDAERWQLYDDDGNALDGQSGTKDEIYAGLLHGAAHVWIWRSRQGELELLLQKRSPGKRTWPNCWDISAAGHIDLGEEPLTAAIRETQEEIGIELRAQDLVFLIRRRDRLTAPNGAIENEFRWIYAFRLEDETDYFLEEGRVDAVAWKPLKTIKQELVGAGSQTSYVPQGQEYFDEVFGAIEQLARSK